MTDQLTKCPKCKAEDACYKTPINEFHNSYTCLDCGFTTSDLMRVGEFDFEQYEETIPELYKDIKYTDEDGRVWYPQVINIENQGTVFVNGDSSENWYWSGIRSVELTEEEKQMNKFKGKTHKSDSASLQNFGDSFFDACDYISFFDVK
jgi:hypothetical protein